MKEERRRQAVRERLSKQQQLGTDKGQGQPGLNGRPQKLAAGAATVAIADSKETKEEKQKRQVILTNVDDTLDERRLGEAFSKFDVEVSLIPIYDLHAILYTNIYMYLIYVYIHTYVYTYTYIYTYIMYVCMYMCLWEFMAYSQS